MDSHIRIDDGAVRRVPLHAVDAAVDKLVARVGRSSVHRLTQEQLTQQPQRVLFDLANFLGVAPAPAWCLGLSLFLGVASRLSGLGVPMQSKRGVRA